MCIKYFCCFHITCLSFTCMYQDICFSTGCNTNAAMEPMKHDTEKNQYGDDKFVR